MHDPGRIQAAPRLRRPKLQVALGILTFLAVLAGAVGFSLWGVPRARDLLTGGRLLEVYTYDGRSVAVPDFIVWDASGKKPLFVSSYRMLTPIPRIHLAPGAEVQVFAPGCGLFRGSADQTRRVDLPRPIRVTIHVAGQHSLPSDKSGIELTFVPEDEHEEVTTRLTRAAVESDYWDWPRDERNNDVWIDPATRSVSALLPCLGQWRIRWTHTDRDPSRARGEHRHISIIWARGETSVMIGDDDQLVTLTIPAEELDLR